MKWLAVAGWVLVTVVSLEAFAWAVEWDWRWLSGLGLVLAAAAGAAWKVYRAEKGAD